jgi:FAD/FMN-containing dehydrogenase
MSNNLFHIPEPETVMSWGMTHVTKSPVLRPTTQEEIETIFKESNARGLKIAFRGGGCSYGDASLNSEGIIVDMCNYNRIKGWDSQTGTIKAESGVSIKQLWEFAIEKGYWPPVVSGTMVPTLGGALSMNIHGKNNFGNGPIGDHIIEFTFLTPSGETLTCNRSQNTDLFFAAISGLGMLGCFLEITLKLKKIYSGKVIVTPVATNNLQEMIDYFEVNYQTSDYLVGWVDAFATGKSIGRGQIHKANYIADGEDPDAKNNMKLVNQHLPSRFFGIIPKSWMWLFMLPFSNKYGMRLINFAKFTSSRLQSKPYKQGHAEFAFLLDYVPNWKFIYKPGSMIQYQVFIPKENGNKALVAILEHCQKKGIASYLAVFKKHRKDNFLLTHSVDGYSMALDFPITKNNKSKVWEMCHELDEIVIANNGRFYFAKDSTLRSIVAEKIFTKTIISKFKKLKEKYDPK